MKETLIKTAIYPEEVLKGPVLDFFHEDVCRQWILKRIHGGKAQCPRCHGAIEGKSEASFWADRMVKCRRCGKMFDAKTGTFIVGMHFSYSQLVLLSLLLAIGWNNRRIAALVGCSGPTVGLWRRKFEAFKKLRREP